MDERSWQDLLPLALFPGSTVTGRVATRPLESTQVGQTTGNSSEQQHDHEGPRQHPQVQLGLRLDQVPLQRMRAYRAQELAEKTIEGFHRLHTSRTMTNKQLAAERTIKELNANDKPRYMNITRYDVSAWPTHWDLRQYLMAFDDFFFFGALKSWTTLDLQHHDIPSHGGMAVGWIHDKPDVLPFTLITITDRHALWHEPEYRYNAILGALLHEMVHALFRVFSCKCAQCRVGEAVIASVGLTGHGPAWQLLAARVEEAVAAHWPDLRYLVAEGCLGLDVSFVLEQERIQLLQRSRALNPVREPHRDDEPVARRTRSYTRIQRMQNDTT